MRTCPSCGEENTERAKFCSNCGAALGEVRAQPREVRKTVTVLFSDMTGSTALGERLDPEALRRLMSRYFSEMKAVLERHGASVEKFIGDAVMAVFGIPVLHEDDALRACRAAVEMREALAVLNKEVERDLGVAIAARTGVNTGEVVAGDPASGQTLVTGDAVNTAARLEQAAAPGEILIGESTFRLVRDAIVAEDAATVAAKGKAEPVRAHRLLEAHPTALGHARRLDSPMVGRDRELNLLLQAFDRAVSERSSHLFTVLGSAGVGKSRLVAEFLERVGDRATVLSGRCLPYGEGITFWPVAEAVKQAAGILDDDPPERARERIASLVASEEHGPIIANHVAQVVGLVANSAAPEETFWAIRALFEAVARERPLVLVLDDIHWGEPAFLDLVEHIADWSRDVPILLLCPARPELLDIRPAWGGGKMNASTILLEPLPAEKASTLVHNLVGAVELPEEVVTRITEAAEGNPLFVEEMLGMLIDEGRLVHEDGAWVPASDLSAINVPPTIQALLAARLDRLEPEERSAIERAAVVGRDFWLGAVVDLSPEALRPGAPVSLMALVRKELLRPAHSTVAGDPAYRFRHMLIRDAAYDSIPKETRAELHERFADWLEDVTGERAAEYDEIIGYHLEQSHRYRTELGRLDDSAGATAVRAAGHLLPAGHRAYARGDLPAASNLLSRSYELLPDRHPDRLEIAPLLGETLWELGRFGQADQVLTAAVQQAESVSNRRVAARARVERAFVLISTAPKGQAMEEVDREAEADIRVLGEEGDDFGLARAWMLRANVANMLADNAAMAESSRQAIEHSLRASTSAQGGTVETYGAALTNGSVPLSEALRQFEEIARRLPGEPVVERRVAFAVAQMRMEAGDERGARDAVATILASLPEMGGIPEALATWLAGMIERLAGDAVAAERFYRASYQVFEAIGEHSFLSTLACELGFLVHERGRDDEAFELSRVGQELGSLEDLATQFLWRDLRARVLARRGEIDEAQALADEALRLVDDSDNSLFQARVRLGVAEVLAAAGRHHDARRHLSDAVAIAERKEAVPLAHEARTRLSELQAGG